MVLRGVNANELGLPLYSKTLASTSWYGLIEFVRVSALVF